MRKTTIILIILGVVLCTSATAYAIVYCSKNPQAAVCQESDVESSDDGGDDTDGEDCDHDDSVAKGDIECIGIPGKEGTVTSTRKPTTTRTQGTTTKTTVTNKKFK